MRFLSAIVHKLVSNRWWVIRTNDTMVDEVPIRALSGAFLTAGRSGLQASASFNRMCEAMNRIGPTARAAGISTDETAAALRALGAAGVSQENFEAMTSALTYARPPNMNVTIAGITGTTATSMTQPMPEPEPMPKKVRSLIRKIRFNGGSYDTTTRYAEFAKGTEARTRVLSRRNANKVRKHCL